MNLTPPREFKNAIQFTRKNGAGEGVRTLDPQLGRLVLYQLSYTRLQVSLKIEEWWRGLDSNQRRHTPADLQSAPFSHSGTTPWSCSQDLNLRPSVYKTDALPTELEQPIELLNIKDETYVYNGINLQRQVFFRRD
jgi:hypothetical protein